MAGRGAQSFQKRQKELARKEKRQEKEARRARRKQEKELGITTSPDDEVENMEPGPYEDTEEEGVYTPAAHPNAD